jgi:hypothetical protein
MSLRALISPDPKVLKSPNNDPVGPNNDQWIRYAADQSDKVVFAWRVDYGHIKKRNEKVRKLLKNYDHYCIEKSKNGKHPKHPLFLKKDLFPILF